MTTRPSAELRRKVVKRAGNRCEYCLIPQELAAARHQVDHVIAEKHGGTTELANLALSCAICNRRKGSDVASVDPETGDIVPLFDPRDSAWLDHFRFDGPRVVALSPQGRATVALLRLNAFERLVERSEQIAARRYAPEAHG